MLASLLPGLRDVRVPLTVGYLWLLVGWLWFADKLPTERPVEDGLVRRLFELGDLLGPAALLAGISFVAYLLGTLLEVPLNVRLPSWIYRLLPVSSVDARETRREYQVYLGDLGDQLEEKARGLPPHEYDAVSDDFIRATRSTVDALRPRLLVANQELYGEYDRLAAEAAFRVNVSPPLLALGVTAACSLSLWWIIPTVVVPPLLLIKGLRKQTQSLSVIQRAVLTRVIEHPAVTILKRWG